MKRATAVDMLTKAVRNLVTEVITLRLAVQEARDAVVASATEQRRGGREESALLGVVRSRLQKRRDETAAQPSVLAFNTGQEDAFREAIRIVDEVRLVRGRT